MSVSFGIQFAYDKVSLGCDQLNSLGRYGGDSRQLPGLLHTSPRWGFGGDAG
jgi:hypothetical protein